MQSRYIYVEVFRLNDKSLNRINDLFLNMKPFKQKMNDVGYLKKYN